MKFYIKSSHLNEMNDDLYHGKSGHRKIKLVDTIGMSVAFSKEEKRTSLGVQYRRLIPAPVDRTSASA